MTETADRHRRFRLISFPPRVLDVADNDWLAMAVDASAYAVREHPDLVRGVLTLTKPRVSAVFAPHEERGRITARLAAAGVEVLGVALSTNSRGGRTFAAVVRSADVGALSAIVAAEDG